MLIVLGFDSFDGQRVSKYPTPTIDGLNECGTMTTPDGLDSSELHTSILWPALFAGEHPHDLFPEFFSETDREMTGNWDSDVLNSRFVSRMEGLAVQYLPPRLLHLLKRAASSTGVQRQSFFESKLHDNSELLSLADSPKLISFPRINEDEANAELKSLFSTYSESASEENNYELDVTPSTIEEKAYVADVSRLLRTVYAIDSRNHDFVFTHFYSLDIIQHIWADSDSMMTRWYDLYDHLLSQVQTVTRSNDTIVVASDHGMKRDGTHSKRAFFGSSTPMWDAEPYEMVALADHLVAELESGNHSVESSESTDSVSISKETTEHLEDLGYI